MRTIFIASGANRNQVQAMADNVDEVLGRAGVEPKQMEGLSECKLDFNGL